MQHVKLYRLLHVILSLFSTFIHTHAEANGQGCVGVTQKARSEGVTQKARSEVSMFITRYTYEWSVPHTNVCASGNGRSLLYRQRMLPLLAGSQ